MNSENESGIRKKKSRMEKLKMSELQVYINEQLKDPEFKEEWDSLATEMEKICATISARDSQNLTQKNFRR